MKISDEIARRRTFAIISHPDAGKTTLTEKLLLYGGAVQLAGSVTARKNRRSTTSDWMELEKKRGISVSSTVLQFEYSGYCVNLLDTPGHKDFSEDTYRVLTAVDAVVMIIDAGKGIESQTLKLFQICRQRKMPIFTFMNKLDRPTKEPLALLDELESVLGMSAYAVNWPLGTGLEFKGVYSRVAKQVHLFERTAGGAFRAPESITDLSDPFVRTKLSELAYSNAVEELSLLDSAAFSFDHEAVLRGEMTPVFFGSASNNFGVQLLLDFFLEHAPQPSAHISVNGEKIGPDHTSFSGFVFKMQANMDPKHRDRIAFLRICSGVFQREMPVIHAQSGKRMRLSSAHKLFGQERETVDIAYPGDVVGLVGNSDVNIGDTLTDEPSISYDEIPRFPPECFAYIVNSNILGFKRFQQGLTQLLREGVVQSFEVKGSTRNAPLLAAVGPLQFEVVQFRLESEYGAESRLEVAPWKLVRWISSESTADMSALNVPYGTTFGMDAESRPVVFFPEEWAAKHFLEKNKGLVLVDIPEKKANR